MYSYNVCDFILKQFTGVICPVDIKHPFVRIEAEPFNYGSNVIFCLGCLKQYNLVHFVAMARNQSVIEACKDINSLLGSEIATVPPLITNAPIFKKTKELPAITLETSDYWLSRGINAETQAFYGAGPSEGQPAIPLYSPDDELVGVMTRNPNWPTDTEDPEMKKYLMYGAIRSEVMGLKQARSLNKTYRVLVEGPVDVMKCYQAGIPAIAINNNVPSLKQIDIINKETNTLLIATDNDEHGNFFMESKAFKIYIQPFFKYERLSLPEGKDPGSMTIEELTNLIETSEILSK